LAQPHTTWARAKRGPRDEGSSRGFFMRVLHRRSHGGSLRRFHRGSPRRFSAALPPELSITALTPQPNGAHVEHDGSHVGSGRTLRGGTTGVLQWSPTPSGTPVGTVSEEQTWNRREERLVEPSWRTTRGTAVENERGTAVKNERRTAVKNPRGNGRGEPP
jgi:hypothetical protein